MRKNKAVLLLITGMWLMIAVGIWAVQAENDAQRLLSLSVNGERIECWLNASGEYCLFVPGWAEAKDICIQLHTDKPVSIAGIPLAEGMDTSAFEWNTPLSMQTPAGEKKITFVQTSRIPALYIHTESGNMNYVHGDKENEEKGTLRLFESSGALQYEGTLQAIKGRGNSTWKEYDKKPYRLKLESEADLLGMGEAQNWILLANASDGSHIKNKLMYDLAAETNMPYSPESRWVDLYLNGEYAGLYLLCERNEVHPQRVAIHGEGSFLVSLEMWERLAAQEYFMTEQRQAIKVRYPSSMTETEQQTLQQLWQSVENAITAADGIDPVTQKSWLEWIDLDSWVRKYLIEELSASTDACYISQYFYLDASQPDARIMAGPVWDYDYALDNFGGGYFPYQHGLMANRLQVKPGYETPWFHLLYQKPVIYERMVEVFRTDFCPAIEQMVETGIDAYAALIKQSAAANQLRWPSDAGFDEQVETVRRALEEKAALMSSIWLDNREYCTVRVHTKPEQTYTYLSVPKGETLAAMPDMKDAEGISFMGWYRAEDDQPFDRTQPITEDCEIYGLWTGVSERWMSRIGKLLPLGVIGMMGVVLLAADLWMNRKRRLKAHER